MFSSLKSVSQIQSTTPPLSEWLTTVADYLAHTKPGKTSEPFSEHVYLVDSYFEKLCEAHGLDNIIDKLVWSIVEREFAASIKKERIAEYLKKLFVCVIHFHDFGKINKSFQAHPKKMNNDKFKQKYDSLIGTSHSSLGAYLYIVKYLQESSTLGFTRTETEKIHPIILLFSYPIFKHHSPYLSTPIDGGVHFGEEAKEMSEYISCYQFDIHPNLREIIPLNLKNRYFDSINKNLQINFALYALVKLSFSLLTASDYLATHEYMSNDKTVDLGVLTNRSRIDEIIQNLRQYDHNKETFEQVDGYVFQEDRLQERSNKNLNLLRREMAIELIQTIRTFPDKRLYYIEAPTGGGKTNLSMIALTELLEKNSDIRKVFYVFPFTTLITQTYKAVQKTLKLTNLELAELHSKAGFQSKNERDEQKADGMYGRDKKDFIDNLFALYPVTLLSHVRFFDVLKTNSKEANYLLHRLANSVVIVDELQSYNPKIWDKMLYFISQYAEYFNIRFILMSATLPKLDKLNLQLNPIPTFQELLPNAQKYLENPNFAQRVQFNFDLYDRQFDAKNEEDWIDLAGIVVDKSKQFAERNREHSTVHIIVEFIYKKSASAFKQVIEKVDHPFDEIFVLSGTILEFRRRQIINQLKNTQYRKKNILLITTQVVEAGVDIDMDLGFKNVSLLDSDEQLAGRVNRNANKGLCEVYLFRLDDSRVIYGSDYRYKVVQEGKVSKEVAQEILSKKRFDKLYQEVFGKIDGFNQGAYADNFSGEILDNLTRLNFSEIDKRFRIIDQQNESVFVPIYIPVWIESPEDGKQEAVFTEDDRAFLSYYGVYNEGEEGVNGKDVWRLYERFIWNNIDNKKKKKGFDLDDMINFKTLQSILTEFSFSLMSHAKTIEKMRSFCLNADTTYGYFYLLHHEKVYQVESGLMEDAFDASENSFL